MKKLLAIVILLAAGLIGGSGFVSGTVRWLIVNPVAAAVLGIVGWLVFVYASPYRKCRWCKKRKTGKRKGKRRRWFGRGRCWRCKGTRETRRFLAYRIHKVKHSLIQAWNEREARDEQVR